MRLHRQTWTILWTLVALALAGTNSTLGQEAKANPPVFEGKWWLSTSSEEQLGYLNGDTDCRIFELGISKKYSHSLIEEQKFVTSFYEKNPDLKGEPVFAVISKIWKTPAPAGPVGGEVWTEPHWYFDGNWWTQSSPLDRLGFVEGYLSCYTEKRSKNKVKFSRTPSFYVGLISRWYRVDDPPPIPVKATEDKIAPVLLMFRDEAKPLAEVEHP